MVILKVYQGSEAPTTYNDFRAIPLEVLNEIQVLAEYSKSDAISLLDSTPKLYTNYLKEGYGSVNVVLLSDVKDFLNNITF